MTIVEKNIEIAKMLGAEAEEWYPYNKETKSTGIYYKFPKEIAQKLPSTFLQVSGDYGLKFHSDANWQFEAIDFIEGQGHPVFIVRNDVVIKSNATISSSSVWNGTQQKFSNKKEAIFEAIYQFSKYLKNNNHVKTNSKNVSF